MLRSPVPLLYGQTLTACNSNNSEPLPPSLAKAVSLEHDASDRSLDKKLHRPQITQDLSKCLESHPFLWPESLTVDIDPLMHSQLLKQPATSLLGSAVNCNTPSRASFRYDMKLTSGSFHSMPLLSPFSFQCRSPATVSASPPQSSVSTSMEYGSSHPCDVEPGALQSSSGDHSITRDKKHHCIAKGGGAGRKKKSPKCKSPKSATNDGSESSRSPALEKSDIIATFRRHEPTSGIRYLASGQVIYIGDDDDDVLLGQSPVTVSDHTTCNSTSRAISTNSITFKELPTVGVAHTSRRLKAKSVQSRRNVSDPPLMQIESDCLMDDPEGVLEMSKIASLRTATERLVKNAGCGTRFEDISDGEDDVARLLNFAMTTEPSFGRCTNQSLIPMTMSTTTQVLICSLNVNIL